LNIVAVNIEPLTPTIVYAATPGGLFKSTDGGANWSPRNAGLVGTNIASMMRDTSGATANWYVATGSNLYVSTNGVESWTLVKNFNAGTVHAAAVHWPDAYVGTQTQGVWVHHASHIVYAPLIRR
jgi:photosystem II stability/assembly factor-like uncharacterized protein